LFSFTSPYSTSAFGVVINILSDGSCRIKEALSFVFHHTLDYTKKPKGSKGLKDVLP